MNGVDGLAAVVRKAMQKRNIPGAKGSFAVRTDLFHDECRYECRYAYSRDQVDAFPCIHPTKQICIVYVGIKLINIKSAGSGIQHTDRICNKIDCKKDCDMMHHYIEAAHTDPIQTSSYRSVRDDT